MDLNGVEKSHQNFGLTAGGPDCLLLGARLLPRWLPVASRQVLHLLRDVHHFSDYHGDFGNTGSHCNVRGDDSFSLGVLYLVGRYSEANQSKQLEVSAVLQQALLHGKVHVF